MAYRPTIHPEIAPLLKAVKARIEALSSVSSSPKDGGDIFCRNKTPFLHLEVRRDHMTLDLWLPPEQLEDARASGIARSHPFLGEEAVKVRFERAQDLSRVARWIEASHAFAMERARRRGKKKPTKPAMIVAPAPPRRLQVTVVLPPAPNASNQAPIVAEGTLTPRTEKSGAGARPHPRHSRRITKSG